MGMMSKEYHEGYQQGFKDAKVDYESRLKANMVAMLEELKAEIDEQVLESLSDGGDDWFTAEKVNECLDILDKYKAEFVPKESEGKE